MIKGVSKKVVEINNPESIYFEKAIFYLRPHMSDIPEKMLAREAEYYIAEISDLNHNKKRNLNRNFSMICVILSILVLASGIVYSIFASA